jgi:hypothetical protein
MRATREFDCCECGDTVFSFVPEGGPPQTWTYDAQTDRWTCDECSPNEDDDGDRT